MAIGFGINTFQSTVSKIKMNDGNTVVEAELNKEQQEGLGRLDINLGLSFYF